MIGYAARIGIGPLVVPVAETLEWRPSESGTKNRTVWGGALPVGSAAGVDWRSPALEAKGRWEPFVAGRTTEMLYQDPAGQIEWTCCCPAARTRVCVGNNHYEGLGYAERLVLTLPPAKLPLRELHWGRFISETQSCVWIRWRGSVKRSWCFHNGQAVVATPSAGPGLHWPGHQLELDRGQVLRSGRITDTACGEARWLRSLLPAVIRNLDETKWCSAGLLTDSLGQKHSGWAIHEVATFA